MLSLEVKDKYHIPLTCRIKKKENQMNKQNRNRGIDTENKIDVATREGSRGMK